MNSAPFNKKDIDIYFPSHFILGGFTEEAINNILYYFIYNQSNKVDYNMEEVAEYILKNYYSVRKNGAINKFISQLDLTYVKRKMKYTDLDFAIDELIGVFDLFPDTKNDAIELYQINFVSKFLNIPIDGECVSKVFKKMLQNKEITNHVSMISFADIYELKFKKKYIENSILNDPPNDVNYLD